MKGNMSDNGSFKGKRVYFSQVSNHAIRDNELSMKAKGLYALIQSYITIENFILYKNTLKKQCKEGEKAFESAWKELKVRGYLLQNRHKHSNGTFYYEYELLDEVHNPKKEGVDNALYGEGGIYSNTDLTNTDLNNIKRYIILPNNVTFSKIYKDCFYNKFNKEHMEVEESNYDEVMSWINELEDSGIDADYFEERVQEHFDILSNKNNGNILAFMESSFRWFEVNNPRQVRECW